MTVTGQKRTEPIHDVSCARKLRERLLAQVHPDEPVPPAIAAVIAAEIEAHCGHRRLKCRRLAAGWTVAQAVQAAHDLVEREGLEKVGLTERSWKDWEAGGQPSPYYQDLLCRLFTTGPVQLGFATDYSPRPDIAHPEDAVRAQGEVPVAAGQMIVLAEAGAARIFPFAEGTSQAVSLAGGLPLVAPGIALGSGGRDLPGVMAAAGLSPSFLSRPPGTPEAGQIPAWDAGQLASGDTVASVIRLGEWDVERRQFMAASSAYALSVLALPDLDDITRRTAATQAGSASVSVGQGEVAAVRQMTKVLGDAAAELGGGHARHLVVRYLTEDVAPWLNGSFTDSTGRELFAAASQLVHLAGWMAGDEGNQGLAQRYYAHSYRLAAEAGDAELSATALRGMAVQAIDHGHRAAAVRLSEECVRHARNLDDPRALAYYKTTLANAAALDGDRRTATSALAAAQTAIERSPNTPGESWAGHYSAGRWAHESGMILARLGDLDAAEDHLHHALDIHGLDRRRTRAIVLADLGQIHLQRDDVGAAVATWHDFLDCADGIRSVKVHDAVQEMRARLDRLGGISGVEELSERAAALRITAA